MKSKLLTLEIAQLSVLTAVHFLIDAFAGMLPVLMPEVLKAFSLQLFQGMVVLTTLNITCNIMQIVTGNLRSNKENPLFLQLGLILASVICLASFIPQNHTFIFLNVMFLISGIGIAITHPEGLRAIHTIQTIPASITTAVFMTGGFLGFASGGWIASHFVQRWGLQGLLPLLMVCAIGIFLIQICKIKLALENKLSTSQPVENITQDMPIDVSQKSEQKDNHAAIQQPIGTCITIWQVFAMSVPITLGATVLMALLPTKLNELGMSLVFGGKAVLLFGVGSAVGSLVWATVAHKKGEIATAIKILFAGVPFLAAYIFVMKCHASIFLLLFGGFLSAASFPLIVTVARKAKCLNLGQRMGYIVGGSWGLSSIALLGLAKLAQYVGITPILCLVPICYIAAAVIGLKIQRNVS